MLKLLRLPLLLPALLVSNAWADGYATPVPTAVYRYGWATGTARAQGAYGVPAAARPAAAYASPAASRPLYPPQALSRTAQTRPVARRAATPAPPPEPEFIHLGSSYKPAWGVGLHLGAAMPLGPMANENSIGFAAQVDGLYFASASTTVDVFGLFADLPADFSTLMDINNVQAGSPVPTQLLGLGVRGTYVLTHIQEMSLYVGGGLGLMSGSRTQEITNSTSFPVVWTASSQSLSGLLVVLCVGVTYNVMPHLDAVAEVEYLDVNLAGGTGDSPQVALPTIGVQYAFR